MYKLSYLIVLSCLFSFSKPATLGKQNVKITGKWYYKTHNTFTSVKKDIHAFARWYDFKNKSKVIFSTCTDICGCMRATYYGSWKWESDSTIAITYKQSKRFDGTSYPLKEIRVEKWIVKKIDSTTLKMERVAED